MSDPIFERAEIPSGTLIDSRYLIQGVLGHGGLGRTYLALDTRRFDEPCVLKEFAPRGIGEHSLHKSRDLFKRETKILYQIAHPQIPKFLACFEGDGRLFLVQEYVSGKTYSALLRERQQQGQAFYEDEITQFLKALLPVLEYIHACNIIHRDISPDNIMLADGKNLPVLIDFGVGKQIMLNHYLESIDAGNTKRASYVDDISLVGKVGYAPIEQINLGQCSTSSDLYALAVTVIVLLTGRNPSHLIDRHSSKWQWRSYTEVSDGFAQVINKMLAEMPKNRYQSATEVLAALQELKQPDTTAVQPSKQPKTTSMSTSPAMANPQSNIAKLPGGALSTRPLHFIWICDCSGSMSVDGKIQSLNNAIGEIIPHMRAAAANNPNAQVLVRAIKFSNGAEWHIPDPTPVESFKWTDLRADGITDLGKALCILAEELKSPPMSHRALPPVLVLISDGQPTDDYLSGLRVLMNEPWGRKAVRIAIAIGGDTDYEVLQHFIGHSELKPLRANNPEALVNQIKWASTAVLKAASSPASVSKSTSLGSMPVPVPMPKSVSSISNLDDIW